MKGLDGESQVLGVAAVLQFLKVFDFSPHRAVDLHRLPGQDLQEVGALPELGNEAVQHRQKQEGAEGSPGFAQKLAPFGDLNEIHTL